MYLDKVKIIECIERMSNPGMLIPCNEDEIKVICIIAQIFSKDEIEAMEEELKRIDEMIKELKED
jgi:ribosomal protein S2